MLRPPPISTPFPTRRSSDLSDSNLSQSCRLLSIRYKCRMIRLTDEPTDVLGANRFRRVSDRSEEHTSELQSLRHLVCRLLLEKKKTNRREHQQGKSRPAGHT